MKNVFAFSTAPMWQGCHRLHPDTTAFCDMPSAGIRIASPWTGVAGGVRAECDCNCSGSKSSVSLVSGVMQEKDSAWAEPHNKNPLEKTTLSRQGITAQSKEMKDEGLVRFLLNLYTSC